MISGDDKANKAVGTLDDKYGVELILDLHGCDASKFTRESIQQYFEQLCDLIHMQREELFFWDDVNVPENERQTSPHTQGTSAVQFILTSSIVIHTLDQLEAVYINIFSCKAYDPKIAEDFSVKWFRAVDHSARFINRV